MIPIRHARDTDATALIALIAAIYAEYPGCVLDVDGEEPELRAPASHARKLGGMWWIAEDAGRIVGSASIMPAGADAELKKLYVAHAMRGRGLGSQLVRLVEEAARERGAQRLVLWTDTRFESAHRLYERLGYIRQPGTRALHDRSASIEFNFIKPILAASESPR
jgi:putative acetyltransferase